MNSPARMWTAGIKTCGKPFSSVKASKDHTLIPSFSPPRSHTFHSLFLTPFSPSKGRDLKGPWLRENRAREGQLSESIIVTWANATYIAKICVPFTQIQELVIGHLVIWFVCYLHFAGAVLPTIPPIAGHKKKLGLWTEHELRVPGLTIRNCADNSNNLVQWCAKVSAIHMTAKHDLSICI